MPTHFDILPITHAYDFAAQRHKAQRRKGETAEPYINHLCEVAHLLALATQGVDAELLIAGVLHDIIEDTKTTTEELVALFGRAVTDLVAEVSDNKALPKQQRKLLQIEHAPHKSPRAKLIKIADKISNLRSLITSPPADWPVERKKEYCDWAQKVVAGCRGVNDVLDKWFDQELQACLLRLNP